MYIHVFCILSLVALSLQLNDPLKDFCRIFGHQTTVVDRKLYIDGGLVNWASPPLSASSLNYSSTWIKEADLDEDNDGFPQQSVLGKNETVPSVHGGTLWADEVNKVIYMYGGEYGNGIPESFSLWYYDIVYNTWNVSNASVANVQRASWGAGVTVQDRAEGYYYGGWLSNASVPGYNSRTPLQNMLVYNMLGSSFRNQSGPDDIPRAEGVMLYVPAGDAGMLVYFGGLEFPYGNSTSRGLNMSEILVYSIGDDLWYRETATGDVPEARRRFCAGATWADDRSSYNIYLFGGASIDKGVGYGDVYVLSLPSFTWIKFWPRPEDNVGATFPHHSLTCDVIGNSQMIIQGGHFPNLTSDCDVPKIYGQHGLDLGKANSNGAKWAEFNPNLTTYQVPTEIAKTIGGGPTGGATVLAPTAGWKERDLQVQFGRQYTPTARTPTRFIPEATGTSQPEDSNRKAIIGGAVGGAVGGLLLVAAIGFCIFFYRRRRATRSQNPTPRPPSELPSNPPMDGVKSATVSSFHGHSPSVTQYTHTPHGSPPPPSDHAWSHYSHPPSDYAGQTVYAQPQPQLSPHHRSPSSDQSYAGYPQSSPGIGGYDKSSPHSPTTARHEMPIVRSPPSFAHAEMDASIQPVNTQNFDPYFAQNPPQKS